VYVRDDGLGGLYFFSLPPTLPPADFLAARRIEQLHAKIGQQCVVKPPAEW
jgi:hypothetical protein